MKTGRFGMQFIICLTAALVLTVLLGACAQPTQTTAPAPTTAAPAPTTAAPAPTKAAPAPTKAAPSPTTAAPSPTKILKIGMINWLGFPIGLDAAHGEEILADMVNQKGGLNIGGQQYKIQLVSYDSNNAQTTEVSAVNRLIYEDNVKFILADGTFLPAWLDIAEKNKVIALASIQNQSSLEPKYHYVFNPTTSRATNGVVSGWLAKTYPELMKTVALAYPDNQSGHQSATDDSNVWKSFGVTPSLIFYPANQTDMSSLGTKVKALNPGAFGAQGGGFQDATALKAVYQAGYQGQLIATSTMPSQIMVTIMTAEAVEGLISGAWPVEFDPAATQTAKDFKAAWIARFGPWEGSETLLISTFSCVAAALEQAGTLDTEKVAALIGSGFKFDSPNGLIQMINRPDLGNERTVDSVAQTYIKQIKGGQPALLATVTLEEALQYYRISHPTK